MTSPPDPESFSGVALRGADMREGLATAWRRTPSDPESLKAEQNAAPGSAGPARSLAIPIAAAPERILLRAVPVRATVAAARRGRLSGRGDSPNCGELTPSEPALGRRRSIRLLQSGLVPISTQWTTPNEGRN